MIKSTVIPIIMSTDENYVNYMAVTIISVMEHSSLEHTYHFFILDCGINDNSKKKIVRQVTEYTNAKIDFLDVKKYLAKYQHLLLVRGHFSVACYMRIFVCDILDNFNKVLYIDVDTVILHDVEILYKTPLNNHILAACTDITVEATILSSDTMADYCYKQLGLSPDHTYFNSGVLLINAKKWRDENYTIQCIEKLTEIKTPLYPDQCILNTVCKNDILLLSPQWNYQWHFGEINDLTTIRNKTKFTKLLEDYHLAGNNPFLIHYTSDIKPWNNLQRSLIEYWWHYARKSYFYEQILSKYILSNQKAPHQKSTKTEEKIYFLGIRIFKVKKHNNTKTYYIFNVPIFNIKKKL